MKHELLVPVGDMESLKQAISNGADAIYLGCKNFGARKFATNFTNEEIIEAIKLSHLYGVKVYVTMNTLIKDNEISSFLTQVEFLYQNGVDALIVQDFGMICLLREKYKDLEIHASTQANTSAKDTAELFYKLGVKRVVFSRELSLEEIESIKVPIEKEVFIHGALCISYSGCCLMSSMIGNRSGNRGECAGSCRLPYTLKRNNRPITENKYLLSTKELNTAPRFKELLDSSIKSFKIEGRMKSPEYVGFITRYYRKLIDTYGTNYSLEADTDKLKTIYNRNFTVGRLFKSSDQDLMNQETPNHIGLEIGRVVEVTENKIKIALTKPLNQQDGIRFLKSGKGLIVNYLYDEKDNLISSAKDFCYVDNKVGLTEKDIVCKTLDYNLMNELKVLPARKVPVTFKVIARKNSPLYIEVSDREHTIHGTASNVEEAQTAPMTEERIRQQVEKLGDTPFVSTSTIIEADTNVFISVKVLNDLRRALINNLMLLRMENNVKMQVDNLNIEPMTFEKENYLTATVRTEEQFTECNSLGFKRIYIANEELYKAYRNYENAYYKLPRCRFLPTTKLMKKNIVSDYFAFDNYDYITGDYGLNVTNIYTAYYLYKMSVDCVTLSPELTEEEIIAFINNYVNTFKTYPKIEILAYGIIENMLIKGNILELKENDYTYTLVDNRNRVFPVYFDSVNTHVLNYTIRHLENIKTLKDYATLRFDFTTETREEIKKIVEQYK